LAVIFKHEPWKGFRIQEMSVEAGGRKTALLPGMTADEIDTLNVLADGTWVWIPLRKSGAEFAVVRDRCFFTWVDRPQRSAVGAPVWHPGYPQGFFIPHVQGLIHLPGLRGNPERVYP
jgi:hypothetical protein